MTQMLKSTQIGQFLKAQALDYIKDTSGDTAIEYGLIAGMVAFGAVAGAKTVGNNTSAMLCEVEKSLDQ